MNIKKGDKVIVKSDFVENANVLEGDILTVTTVLPAIRRILTTNKNGCVDYWEFNYPNDFLEKVRKNSNIKFVRC